MTAPTPNPSSQPEAGTKDAEAQYNLGLKYEKGHGVKQDDEQAVAWWTLAAEQGYMEALNSKKEAEAKMTPAEVAEARALAKTLMKK